MYSKDETRNLILALVLSSIILIIWQGTVPTDLKKIPEVVKIEEIIKAKKFSFVTREESLQKEKRISILNNSLSGSINTKGLRFDDLTLEKYNKTIDENSGKVELLSPSQTSDEYFAEFGWIGNTKTPTKETIWSADKEKLTPNETVTFSWTNSDSVEFKVLLSLDENYMFEINQVVNNNSGESIKVFPYGLISKREKKEIEKNQRSSTGFVGVFNRELNEYKYKELRKEKLSFNDKNGWFGFSDKYWVTAIIPQRNTDFTANVNYVEKLDKYQADYLGEEQEIASGASNKSTTYFYSGAKEVKLIDKYSEELNIPLFDRTIDFGWLYFLTKPIFLILNLFYQYVGNLGIAIILLTISIKVALFPIAKKSFSSMDSMKKMQPQMKKLQEKYKDDKMKLNKEMMALYKKEGLNPAAGCLPLLIQIPVFFSLFKVLRISIETRHAPFFGWIQDLSAPDPTSVFNLFGLIPWTPPQFLLIGALPVLSCITTIIQQKFNPKPADATQAKVMKVMPYFFLILSANFPTGVLVYWICNNTLTIVQQFFTKKK